ncbi:MAG: ribonuclease HI [Firmicutes bacterium]|nr:ribonuclease HI [Bacillota bacterium]
MKQVTIHTDGACSGNPGPGGWAAVLSYNGARKELGGGSPGTTNNRMELTAVIKALEALKEPCAVSLYSDSSYVCNAFNKKWVYKWESNGWMRKNEPVPNADLWTELLKLTERHSVMFVWVRGHADNAENQRCDELARGNIERSRQAMI